jgi:hypothetical protein
MRFTAPKTTLRLLLAVWAGDGGVGESADARRQSVLPQELQRRLSISSERGSVSREAKYLEVADGVTGFS